MFEVPYGQWCCNYCDVVGLFTRCYIDSPVALIAQVDMGCIGILVWCQFTVKLCGVRYYFYFLNKRYLQCT